jgi:hypothetical protein
MTSCQQWSSNLSMEVMQFPSWRWRPVTDNAKI